MKNRKLFISAIALLMYQMIGHAQLINSGFETWSTNALVPTAMDPNSGNGSTGWWDYNFFNYSLAGGSPISVIRCTDTVRSGNYSVRLETQPYTATSWNFYKNWGIPFIGHQYNDTLGILFDGTANVLAQTYTPGISCSQNLTQFKFYYQYRPHLNDTAECRVLLLHAGTPVAGGSFKTNVATGNSGWQLAIVNFTYVSALTPDTLYVLFSSSSLDASPKAHSVLWIDDASVVLPTGVEQMLESDNDIKIYPNPSNGKFIIQLAESNNEKQIVEIYDLLGEKIFSETYFHQRKCSVDLTNQPKGIYLVKILNGEKVITEKICIQ